MIFFALPSVSPSSGGWSSQWEGGCQGKERLLIALRFKKNPRCVKDEPLSDPGRPCPVDHDGQQFRMWELASWGAAGRRHLRLLA